MTENSPDEIRKRLDAQAEWLLIHSSGRTFSLRSGEIEISSEPGKILFGFLDDKGFRTRRVTGCKIEGGEIFLDLSGNFGREKERIKLVPRVSARELSETVELARLEKANEIGRLIEKTVVGARLLRVGLNEENGRFARIIFELRKDEQTAVLADVSDNLTPEILLTTAILWLDRLRRRRKYPIRAIWIVSGEKQARNLQKIHALLGENWKEKIKIFQLAREKGASEETLTELPSWRIGQLWRARPAAINLPDDAEPSRAAQRIIESSPGEIDSIHSRHGETLRFFGLPFARVRRIFEREKIWFGTGPNRSPLTEENARELAELIDDLKTYRRFDSPNRRHAFYLSSPEAWLEAVLRKNIKLLDPHLILSPLYHQFRAERDKIDLLALRRDGRLVIVELKVAPDREAIFQAADYWRKIERQRRKGNLQTAKLFGGARISDRPALVYLVAPTLSFHRDFEFLAGTISPEIEIYRFDLNENWREKIRAVPRP